MAKKLFCKKCRATIFATLLFFNLIHGQSLVFRPYYGHKYLWTKYKELPNNNFDPSFTSTFANNSITKTNDYSWGLALELKYPNHSYEFCYSQQGSVVSFYTKSPTADLGSYSLTTNGKFGQLQFIYNHTFNKLLMGNKDGLNVVPIVSIGLGIGFANSPIYNIFKEERVYSNSDPAKYFDFDLQPKHDNLNYSAIFKAGLIFNKKNRELFRVQLMANLGLNKAIGYNFIYAHTANKYSGTINSYGSDIRIQVSIPITLWRKKRK